MRVTASTAEAGFKVNRGRCEEPVGVHVGPTVALVIAALGSILPHQDRVGRSVGDIFDPAGESVTAEHPGNLSGIAAVTVIGWTCSKRVPWVGWAAVPRLSLCSAGQAVARRGPVPDDPVCAGIVFFRRVARTFEAGRLDLVVVLTGRGRVCD